MKLYVMEFFHYFSRNQHPKIYKKHHSLYWQFFRRRPVLPEPRFTSDKTSGITWTLCTANIGQNGVNHFPGHHVILIVWFTSFQDMFKAFCTRVSSHLQKACCLLPQAMCLKCLMFFLIYCNPCATVNFESLLVVAISITSSKLLINFCLLLSLFFQFSVIHTA